jgi:uncharacterized membrane protein YvlD (DUF360 family)
MEHTSLRAPFPREILLLLVSGAALAVLVWQLIRPTPEVFAGLALDRLSALTGLFIAVVGWVVLRFASRAMEGHAARSRFLTVLAFTVCMAFLSACASNLLLLATAWLSLGTGVHHLLLFGAGSRVGWLAVRRKFVCARLGEIALLSALGLLWWRTGSLELGDCLHASRDMSPETLLPIAMLLSVAAMARSVQLPFHAWLPDTMDAPTPVSALLHAGIVNAGGILLIRFAPLLTRVPEAWLLLSVTGTLTMVLGTLAMAQQGRLKHALAWSTVSQMGFMTVQCALAAFPAAMLHILGHGAWKAMAFLRSGETPSAARPLGPAWWNLVLLAAGTASTLPVLHAVDQWTGCGAWHTVGEAALTSVVMIAVGQAWVASLACVRGPAWSWVSGASQALACTTLAPAACLWLYAAAGWFLRPVLGDLELPQGPLARFAACLPVAAAIGAMAVLHAAQPWLERWPAWRSLLVQARGGFHLGRVTDRTLDAVLPSNPDPETRHA